MSDAPLYLGSFFLMLGVLIVVHEFGHYIVARACGVKVLRFAIGFGKPLWLRRFGRDRTELAVCAFPLGGYVKMLDEREGEVAPADLPRAYNRQGVGRRSLIVVAGPLANFLLAILIYWGMFWTGSLELLPILGTPTAGTPAAQAGIVNGELVRAVDGQKVESWQDFRWLLVQSSVDRDGIELEVINERKEIAYRRLSLSSVREGGWEGEAFDRLGINFFRPHLPPVIGKVMPDSVAEQAGLKAGDEFVAIGDISVHSWYEVQKPISEAPGKLLVIHVRRGDREFSVELRPQAHEQRGKTVGRIGVAAAESTDSRRELRAVVRHDFLDAGARALRETWDKSVFSLVMLGKMLKGEVSWRNLSGPVTIADYAGQSAKMGLDYYLKFMALVSVSLGVLNLLPVPVLDGGHLLYHILEVIKRGPLSERVMELGQQVGLAILLALMAFAFFNDINRLLSG